MKGARPGEVAPQASTLCRALDGLEWAAHVGPYQALGCKVAIRVTDPALGGYLDRTLGSLAADLAESESEHLYSVVDPGPGRGRPVHLYFDGHQVAALASPALALATLLWHLNRSAVASLPGHLLLHAAALEHGGEAILLPGASGSGKTTLAAGLIMDGMGYLSDEVAAMEPSNFTLAPFPKPLTVKEGSWGALAGLAPLADDVPSPYRERQWHLDPRRLRPGSIAGPCRPRLIVFPSYRAGAVTKVNPLGRAEAVALLATQVFTLPDAGQRGLALLADLVRTCDAFTLVVGDLEGACAALRSL